MATMLHLVLRIHQFGGSDLIRAQVSSGDDVSLVSPVMDLSQATSAKLVFDHYFSFCRLLAIRLEIMMAEE